ncbi:hypothetical protein BPTFM16_00115 [Altererythrobacter insulae]|nr:hypothetical protein BPTFM16_00115 [Altererythrobacter insulae]
MKKALASRANDVSLPTQIAIGVVDIGADAILDTLGIAMLKYPADEARRRSEISPWMVRDALARLGYKKLAQSW